MKAFLTIVKIEARLVIRGMDTILFGIGFPVVVALFMGILMKGTAVFTASFAAISTIGICATGLMGMPLTIADYRHRGVLKRYQVTPLSPMWLLLAQWLLQLGVAVCSLILVYLVMHIGFDYQFQGNPLAFFAIYCVICYAIYGLGMMIASVASTMKMANFLCTILYFPILLFSGSLIPYEMMPSMLQHLMDINPLTQGICLLNSIALQTPTSFTETILMLLVLGSVCMLISKHSFRWIPGGK